MGAIEIDRRLADMEIGDAEVVNGKVVMRWTDESYEVVSYGRAHFPRDLACILIGD